MSSEKKPHNLAFGRVLRKERKRRRHTQESFSFLAGLDRTYVSLLELGTNSPTLDTIVDVCAALEMPLADFTKQIDLMLEQLSKKS
jgi:transcriptional regulator with XRE-family HTH domain